MMSMKVHQIFFKNTLRNFCYLITFDDGVIYCIDPFRAEEVSKVLKEHELSAIINTHDHCDHYSGNEELLKQFHCEILAHENAHIPFKTKNLKNAEVIHKCGEWSLICLYTPGHTMSHLGVLLEKSGVPFALFTGDCFFNAGVGNCHNGGDPNILYETISRLFEKLPDELLIYPGHEYLKRNLEFTRKYEPENNEAAEFYKNIQDVNLDEVFFVNSMKIERKINTFLRLESRPLRTHLHLEAADSKSVFLTLRELRNRW
jgi:hydroxyacylglutathione hydrolase